MEISRQGSISRAAQTLYLTQPHLSSTLRELEKELHITIFIRDRKGVTLTQEGREFLQYATALLEQEQRLLSLYRNYSPKPAFHLSISSQRYPFVIKAFQQLYEKMAPERFEVHLRESGMDQVIQDVADKRSELGIIFLSASTESFLTKYLAVRRLEFHELGLVRPCVFFRKTHPMASAEEVDIADMEEYPFACFELSGCVSVDFFEEVLRLDETARDRRFYVSDRGTMINVLTHTDAFSVGTGILTPGFAGAELVSRPLRGHGKEIKLGWIQLEGNCRSDMGTEFLQLLQEVVRQEA